MALRPGRRARHAARHAARGRSALALFLQQALLELAQARIHRRQGIEVAIAGPARDLELLDRGRQAAAQVVHLGLGAVLLGALPEGRVGARQQLPQARITAAVVDAAAQFGRGVMQDVSDKLLQQFVRCIEGRFADAGAETDATSLPTPAALFGDTHPEDVAVPIEASSDESGGSSADDSGAGAPAPAAATAKQTTAAAAPSRPATPASDDALDLGATVLPVVLRSYAPHLGAGLIGFWLGWKLARKLPG